MLSRFGHTGITHATCSILSTVGEMWVYLFRGFLLLALTAHCLKMQNEETRIVQLFLRSNGELEDYSRLHVPNCGPAKKIFLNSYTYNHVQCSSRVACNSVHEEPLSGVIALQIQKNCSFRQQCKPLTLPVPTSLQNVPSSLNAVTIQYQCIGSERLVLNMCEKQELNFDETLHLVFKNYSQNVKKCECWVNKGPFSPIIMDLRLNSRYQDMCSASKLFINTDEYTCDPQSDSYGAIFGQVPNGDLLKDAFISLANNVDIEPPEMVWIAIIPEETSRLVCPGDRFESLEPNNITPTPTRKNQSMSSLDIIDSDSWRPSVTTENGSVKSDRKVLAESMIVTVILALVVAVLICTVTCIICFRSRRRKALSSNYEIQFDIDRKGVQSGAQCKTNPEYDGKEEKSEIGKQCRHRSENIEKADDLKNMSLRRRFIFWIKLLFDLKSIKSRQNPQNQMPVESEIVLVDKDVSRPIQVDIHTHLAASSCDIEEIPLSDENPTSDCYDKANVGSPVQESGLDRRDDPEESRNAYAKLYHSLLNDGDKGNDENTIYNYTQFKKQTPERNPTYNHLPMQRCPMTYNYARNKFLMSQI